MADSLLEHITALRDADWAIREEAALALAEARDSRAVVALSALLKDADRAVREAAMQALRAIGGPSVVTLGACLRDTDLTVQESAASILSSIGDERVLIPFIEVLDSPDWIVRMHAAKGLGRIGDSRAVEPLMPLLQDKVKAVREEATQALAQIGEASLPYLHNALKHEDWLVRLHAVEALGKLKSGQSVEAILSVMFNDTDTAVRVDAARSLGEIGDPRAAKFLITVMRGEHLRPVAIEALGKIGDRCAVPVLLEVVKGTNRPPEGREVYGCGDRYSEEEMVTMGAAVKALALIKDEGSIPTLVGALQNTLVREEAAEALVAFGDRAIPALLQVMRRERDENIQYHVKQALAKVGWRANRR